MHNDENSTDRGAAAKSLTQHFICTAPFFTIFTFSPIVGHVSTGAPELITCSSVVFPLWQEQGSWNCSQQKQASGPVLEPHQHNLELLRVEDLEHP